MAYINPNKVEYTNNSQVDALNRLRTTTIKTMFDSPLKYNKEEFLWDEKIFNGGSSSYNNTENLVDLEVYTTGDRVIRQSRQYFYFQSGKSHVGMLSTNLKQDSANVEKEVGFFDDNNGLFFRYDGYNDNISLVLRSDITGTVTEQVIQKSNWSLDKMDGTGPSKINLDFTNMQLFYFDFAWTGIGRLRVGVVINGEVHYVEQFEAANTQPTNSFGTPSLPIRFEITSNGDNSVLKQQASSILVEGDYDKRGIQTSVNTGLDSVRVSGRTPLISLRLKSEYNRAQIIPNSIKLLQDSLFSTIYYEVIMRPDTFDGITWNSMSELMISEYNTDAENVSGGLLLNSGYIPTRMGMPLSLDLETILPLGSDIDGNTDIISVIAQNASGNNAPVYASLTFREIY
ncbi:hypothetical protein PBI_SCTP2_161 [Salicola phage SCTP-2]|nr:hypothetical protein PBI_SCTP2_161 [Salicola phage SCTP-2]